MRGQVQSHGRTSTRHSQEMPQNLENSEGMICDILFSYASDSEQIKADLLRQLRGVPTHCVCIDNLETSCHETLGNLAHIKLHVVFFSPGFLNFLECRGREAYEYFFNVDPQATVALFCCGLLGKEVYCYHTASLKSYSSWPKYEHATGQKKYSEFSPYFLSLFDEFFPDQNRSTEGVVIVPELINKKSSTVYVIFSNDIQNVEEISAHLEIGSNLQVVPRNVNPHVLYFDIPVMLLERCQSFEVKIKQSGTVLARKVLNVVPDNAISVPQEFDKKSFTENIQKVFGRLDSQPRIGDYVLEDPLDRSKMSSQESVHTISPQEEDINISLIKMCEKYGLEELNPFINEKWSLAESRRYSFFRKDSSESQVNYLWDSNDTEGFPMVHRSLSLPSIVSSSDEYGGPDPDYLPMMPIYPHSKKNLFLYSSRDDSINESNVYVSLKLGEAAENSLTVAKRGLSRSQQELVEMMYAYKRGNATISNVEEQFRVWQQKRNESSNSSGNDEQGDAQKRRSSYMHGDWRRKGIRRSKAVSDIEMEDKRNSSNDSFSSRSSKASDVSICTVQSPSVGGSTKPVREVSTSWTSQFDASSRTCALEPELKPPPVPPRPRFWPRTEESLHRTRSMKSKTDTYKPPNITEFDKSETEYGDDETVKSLIEVCKRYGLQQLGEYYLSGCPDNLAVLRKDDATNTEENYELQRNVSENEDHLQVPGSSKGVPQWDEDHIPSYQRSLSLPSTLFPTHPVSLLEEDIDGHYDTVLNPEDETDPIKCRCGDINALTSGTYMSIMQGITSEQPPLPAGSSLLNGDGYTFASGIYTSLLPPKPNQNVTNQSLQKNALSKSQEELLELMHAFKKGEKTISQVERQFKLWHCRHMTSPSNRDQGLQQLQNEYEKAQKQSKFGIMDIFVLGRPKQWRKDKKTTDENGRSVKKRLGKSNSDTKRLSKTSYTSTSSGVSDNSDFYRYCYDNPGYGQTQDILRGSNSFKPCSSPEGIQPPPLPPRPTPSSTLRLPNFDRKSQNSDFSDGEKSSTKSRSVSPLPGKKEPSPPPKPRNIFERLISTNTENGPTNNKNIGDEQDAENQDVRPGSPIYVTPNRLRRAPSRKKYVNVLPNPACALHYPNNVVSSSCPSTIVRTPNPKGKDTSNWTNQFKYVIHNQLLGFVRPKKRDVAMFYVTRKWSSFPKLDRSDVHTYLDLQELFESRNRLIKNNTTDLVD